MYWRTCSSSKPTVDTAYPRAQKCSPVKFRSLPHKRAIAMALFPSRTAILLSCCSPSQRVGCHSGTVKPIRVSLVEPVAYLKSELGGAIGLAVFSTLGLSVGFAVRLAIGTADQFHESASGAGKMAVAAVDQ